MKMVRKEKGKGSKMPERPTCVIERWKVKEGRGGKGRVEG